MTEILLAVAVLVAALLASLLGLLWRRYQRVRHVAESSVGPATLALIESEGPRALAARGMRVTVLFVDIRGFTRLAETKPVEQIGAFLSSYFSALTPIIADNGGIITTFLGDGLMAVFGAFGEPDHARDAFRTAVAILRALENHRAEWDRLVFQDLQVGIGIHTGSAYVGKVGSQSRYDFTAVGDTVNTAARLEQASKQLNYPVVLSRVTFDSIPEADRAALLPPNMRIDFLGAMFARGKADFPSIYGLTSTGAPKPDDIP